MRFFTSSNNDSIGNQWSTLQDPPVWVMEAAKRWYHHQNVPSYDGILHFVGKKYLYLGFFFLIQPDRIQWSFYWRLKGKKPDALLKKLKSGPGRYKEALLCVNEVLKTNPENTTTLQDKALAFKKLERYEEALGCYDRLIEISPDDTRMWNERGLILIKLGRNHDATQFFDRSLALDSNNFFAWNNKGWCLKNLGRYDEALTCYDRALEIDPNNSTTLKNKGSTLHKLERDEEAINCYKRAVALSPRYLSAWQNLAIALAGINRFEEALDSLDQALHINPNNKAIRSLHNELGSQWSVIGHPSWVIRAAQKWYHEQSNPAYSGVRHFIGDNYLYLGFFERLSGGEVQWHFYRKLKGRQPEKLLSKISKAEGRYEEALAFLNTMLQTNPDDQTTLHNKAIALKSLGRFQEVLGCYDRVIRNDPKDTLLWNNKGFVLLKLGRYEDAIEALDKSLELDPANALAWNNKGTAFRTLGRYEDSIEFFNRALSIDPQYLNACNNMGVAIKDLGRHTEAIGWFDRAIALNPHFAWAWFNKGLAQNELGKGAEALASLNRARELFPHPTINVQQEVLREQLKASVSSGNDSNVTYYCGELVLTALHTGDLKSAYKYLGDLLVYAKGDVKDDVQSLADTMQFMMENEMEVSEDILMKADLLVHRMRGRG